jgi:hypothetical protein
VVERQTITPALKALVRLFWSWPENGTGGTLHTWFADNNWEREHVAWLAGHCRMYPITDGFGNTFTATDRSARLGAYLARVGALYLTDTQRRKLPHIR